MKKPENLLYGVNDVPPHSVTLLNAVQHVGVISINLVYPLLIFRLAGVPTDTVIALLAVGMAILGLSTFLQCAPRGPVGSGYLCPSTFTATYIAPALLAVKAGGLPLVFGMTIFAGLIETALARALHRLRALIPVELSGLVILLIGMTAGLVGVRTLLGGDARAPSGAEWTVAVVTLGITIILNVWGKGLARMLCALVGMAAGYLVAAWFSLFSPADLARLVATPWVALPTLDHVSWSFDAGLATAFAVAAIAAAMKAVGTLTICQRTNDAAWVRPDDASNARGVIADGLGTTLSGLLGGFGINTATPSVGLAAATGVASRRVGYAVGAIFLALALTPKVSALLALMPRPVMGAALVFASCFILINGLQVITSRLLDARRNLTIGLGLIAGVTAEVIPAIAAGSPAWIQPLIGSSLVFGTLVALALNLLFRIGVRQTVAMSLRADAYDPAQVEEFLHRNGARWGARPDIVNRVAFGAGQLIEAVIEHGQVSGALELQARFDEFDLDLRLSYEGVALELPEQRPSAQEIRDTDAGAMRLAGFLLRRNADRVRVEQQGSRVAIWFHFDH
jgi:NCS2 family nucleobase:cation symporter-2